MTVKVTKESPTNPNIRELGSLMAFDFFKFNGELWMFDQDDDGKVYIYNFETTECMHESDLNFSMKVELVDVEIKWRER